MDVTSTAQVITQAASNSVPWWTTILAALFGWALPAAIQKNPALAQNAANAIKNVAAEGAKLAPAAEMVATLSGNPALAGGIEAASKIAAAVTTTTDPGQLATLAVMHGQALAAASTPPAPVQP